MTLTIVLAHNYEIYLQGLCLLLQEQEDFRVIATVTRGFEAIQFVRTLSPDILIVDLILPDSNGIDVARRVRRYAPATHIVLLSKYGDDAHIIEALRSGVTAYVLKGSSPANLFQAICEAYAGGVYLSPPLSDRPVEVYLRQAQRALRDPYATLTGREREVLYLAVRGLTNWQIALTLTLSPRTVETHLANLRYKLRVRNRAELIRFGLQRGIVSLES
jgi:DNA-binding NarL/FixJ family response regulator